MTPARLILLLLLILVAVVLVVVLLRRGSAQRDAHRVEAAELRSEADTLAVTMTGQTAFAEQAAERAEVARAEAERKAAEAARLEAEAAERRAAVEATQRDYETTMRRADDLDPDVKESTFAPVERESATDEPAAAVPGSTDAAPARTTVGPPAAEDEEEPLMTRAERREAREAEEAGGLAPSAAASVPGAGAAGAAAAGASAWGARDDEDTSPSSERIASAADFRDDAEDQHEAHAHDEAAGHDESHAHDEAAGHDESHQHDRAAGHDESHQHDRAAGHDEAAGQDDAPEVYPAADSGTEADMSDEARTDTPEHTQDGFGAGGAAAAATAGAGGTHATTKGTGDDPADETADDPADDTAERTDRVAAADGSSEPTDDLSRDVESPRGEWGGPRQDQPADAAPNRSADVSSDEPAEMTVIGEPEAYAATEPVMASDQTPPVTPDPVGTHDETGAEDAVDRSSDDHLAVEGSNDDHVAVERSNDDLPSASERHDDLPAVTQSSDDHAPAEAGAAVTQADDTDRSAADLAEEPVEERYDPTPTRDWAADEGELLAQTHDRGERLEAERTELAQQESNATGADDSAGADGGTVDDDATGAHDSIGAHGGTGDDDATGATASDVTTDDATSEGTASGERASDGPASDEPDTEERAGRRVSEFHELRDGGFGVGSAAPIDDGAQPLDHPVQGYRDTMTYRVPGDAGYDSAEPHVWFYDEGAAQRSGFRRAEG